MKNYQLKFRLTVVLFIITAAFVFAQNQTAVIKEITGAVELKTSGSSEWTPAKTGDAIEKKTIVSTSFRSTAVLTVGNSTITVRPLTRLSLEELIILNQSETVNVNLNTGRVRVEVKPPAGTRADFTVQSPTTTASVRGTEFEMDTASIQVLEGKVSFASVEGPAVRPVVVSAGEESRVETSTGAIITPKAAEDAVRTLPSLPGQSEVPAPASVLFDFGSLDLDVGIILK